MIRAKGFARIARATKALEAATGFATEIAQILFFFFFCGPSETKD